MRSVVFLLKNGARVDLSQPLDFTAHCFTSATDTYLVWRYHEIAKTLVEKGAMIDPNFRRGDEAIVNMIRPASYPVLVEGAYETLRLLLQENSLKIFEEGVLLYFDCAGEKALNSPNFSLVPYMYGLGYYFEELEALDDARKPEFVRVGVQRLYELARARIRMFLPPPLSDKIQQLPITKVTKNFLCMKEIPPYCRVSEWDEK